jgi:hypothetical protein
MENMTTLAQGIEEVKSLFLQEPQEDTIINNDLAKILAQSFEVAYKSLTILEKITDQ